jgi:hypothetical protein
MRIAALLALIAGLAPVDARAELPAAGCFVLAPGARAAGIDQLALRFIPPRGWDARNPTDWRYGEMTVVMGAARPEVVGKPLTQSLNCRTGRMACAPANGTGWVEIEVPGQDRLVIRTLDLPVGDYGESDLESNLADPPGTETVLHLVRAPDTACEPS